MPAIMEYAGVELPLAPTAAAAWVARNIDPRDVFEADLDMPMFGELGSAKSRTKYAPEIRLHTLQWPRGMSRWATFHATVDGETLTAIRTSLATKYPASSTRPTLKLGDGEQEISTTMFMLPAKPLSGIPGQWYLISLVDERYYWAVEAPLAAFPLSLTNTNQDWSHLLVGAATYAGFAGGQIDGTFTLEAVPSAYLRPNAGRWGFRPENYSWPEMQDRAAEAVQARYVRKLNGDVVCQRYGAALTVYDAIFDTYAHQTNPPPNGKDNLVIAGGQYPNEELGRGLPSSVAVMFEKTTGSAAASHGRNGSTPSGSTHFVESGLYNRSEYVVGTASSFPGRRLYPLSGGEAADYGQIYVNWTDLTFSAGEFPDDDDHFNPLLTTLRRVKIGADYPWKFNRIPTLGTHAFYDEPSNAWASDETTRRSNLATQLATDWWGWRCRASDTLFAGILPVTPNGYLDLIEWTILPLDGRVAATTRVVALRHGIFGSVPKPFFGPAGSTYELSTGAATDTKVEVPQPGYLAVGDQTIHGVKSFRDALVVRYRLPSSTHPNVGTIVAQNMPLFDSGGGFEWVADTSVVTMAGAIGKSSSNRYVANASSECPLVTVGSGPSGVGTGMPSTGVGLLSAGTSAYTSLMSVSAFAGFANFVQAERIAVSGLSSGFLYSLQTNTLTGFLGKWPSSLNAFAGGTYAGSLALCPTHLSGSNFPRFGVFRNAGPTPSTPGPGPYVNPGIDADVHIGNNNYLRFQGGILVGTWVTGPVAGGADTGGSALLNGEGMEGSAEQVAPIGFDGELPTLDGTFTQTLDAWDTANIGFDASTSATFLLNGNDVQYEDGLIWD